MKVIKSGDGRKGWAREETCTGQGNGIDGCGAELLLEENDLYHTRNTDYGGIVTHSPRSDVANVATKQILQMYQAM